MNTVDLAERAKNTVVDTRDRAAAAPVHSDRTAAVLGAALGISFLVCFLTGILSHLIQHPPTWFHWPPRPAGTYRFTHGLHVATGLATIPLLLAKLWSVFPNLLAWPPFKSVAHVIERIMLIPLIFGSVFLLFSGLANTVHWYPWMFSFVPTHYWVSWVTMGGLLAHLGAKSAITRRELFGSKKERVEVEPVPGAMTRRGYLGWTAAAVGLVTITTVGQTVRPLRQLALLAPRRPDIGPQGVPINGVARPKTIDLGASPDYRFSVGGDVPTPLSLTLEELQALPRHSAGLPITCVEGWSAQGDWAGVTIGQLLTAAGVSDDTEVEVEVESFQEDTYQFSMLSNAQARDRDALIALELNGSALVPDHGYPARLIAPNRPGVQQTKWVKAITVRAT